MKPIRTWILIADAARARVFLSTGSVAALAEVPGLTFAADHAATHDIVADRQGRSFDSHGPARHAYEPRVSPHRALKTAFAHRLAHILDEQLKAKAYDRLIVVAPPVLLGDLRAALSAAVQACVTGEAAKDLTKVPDHEIKGHLSELIF